MRQRLALITAILLGWVAGCDGGGTSPGSPVGSPSENTEVAGEPDYAKEVRVAPKRAHFKELFIRGDGRTNCEFAARSVSGEPFTFCVVRAEGYRAYLAGSPYPEPVFIRADTTDLEPVRVPLAEGDYLIAVGNNSSPEPITIWVSSRILAK